MLERYVLRPETQIALTNGRVVLLNEVAADKAVVIAGERITKVCDRNVLGNDIEIFDVGGRYILPGLIDIHTHGALGHSFNEPTEEAFQAITDENARRGVTGVLATTATAAIPDLLQSLARTREWMKLEHNGARVLGAHVEGPYFSVAQRGAQDPSNMRSPDDGTVDQLLEYRDVIRIMSFAPELPGALELTRRLVDLGIVAAAGHSSAREANMTAAIQAGLSHIIHIWSGQSTTVRDGPWRKPGLLEVTLANDDLTVEMIADNKHLPFTLMKLAYKCVGPDRLSIISDAVNGAGLPEGTRYHIGEESEHEVHDGVGMTLDRASFAGSTTLLNEMIPVMTDVVGVPLFEAARMASLNPARVIGLDNRKGSIEVGKDADLAIFDEDFTAWRTMIGGRWVHAAS